VETVCSKGHRRRLLLYKSYRQIIFAGMMFALAMTVLWRKTVLRANSSLQPSVVIASAI